MRIAESSLEMSSNQQKIVRQDKTENLTAWVDRPPANTVLISGIRDLLDLSQKAQNQLSAAGQAAAGVNNIHTEDEPELTDGDKLKIQLIEGFIATITGKKMKLKIPRLQPANTTQNSLLNVTVINPAGTNGGRLGWGISFNYHETYYEKESLSFSAAGVVKTQDGKEISINVQFTMQREFMSQSSISFRAGDAKIDPLVVNYSGALPAFSDTKFSFDLDNDGTAEQISYLLSGSGFLALDHNGDGIINNGGELFGPQSGNGFSELARFDSDGNNWIDENDPIFNKLRIWSKDAQGRDQLLVLGEVGIGAIYLGHIQSPFTFKDNVNQDVGQLQESGVFLRENGTAGTVQHIDLAV